jgi:bla regulator protein BlaR1
MPMDEAVAIVGEPKEEMQGGKNTFIDRILYRDIEGKEGHAYYARSDLNLRLWFSDNRLKHNYVTRSDFGHGKEDRLLTKEELPDGSLINAEGHIEDKIDYPFVDDPRVRGYWVSIDFIGDLNDFNPQVKADPDLYFKEMHLLPEGKSNWAFRWTKGLIFHDGDKTASRYFLREVDGEKYLIFEWKSGDYTIRHWKPGYYVMKQGPEVPYVESRVTDRTDYPFVDDPAVVGTWKSVDFVATPDEFNPNERQWQGGELYLKELVLLPGGKTPKSWQTWTKGLIIHHGDKTASRYLLKTIDGATYLFFEWKSGDYTIRRMKPKYYVLAKP